MIGASSEQAADRIKQLYRPLDAPIIVTGIRSAEIIKYASNAFLALKISFINTVADICENAGGDIEAIAEGIGSDTRIGSAFLNAGLGFGGSCFPKDIESFLHTSAEFNAPFSILEKVMEVNANRAARLVSRIVHRLGEDTDPPLKGKLIAVLGLSFKPETDDMREAKSIEICHLLRRAGAKIRTYDPVAMDNAKKIIGESGITYCTNAYEAVSGADAAVVVTEWREFTQLNLERLKSSLKTPIVFDGRNIYSLEQVAAADIEYHSIGRPSYFPE